MDSNRKSDGRSRYQLERFFARFCALQVLYQLDCRNDWNLTEQDVARYLCLLASVTDDIRYYLPHLLEEPFKQLQDNWQKRQDAEKQLEAEENLLEKGQKAWEEYDRFQELKAAEKQKRKKRPRKDITDMLEGEESEEEQDVPSALSGDEPPFPSVSKEELDEIPAKLEALNREIQEVEGIIREQAAQMVSKQPLAYGMAIVKGVTAMSRQIDEQILKAAKNWRLERMGKVDLNLMRIAAFELLNKPEPPAVGIPPATAINEAIELAKVFCQADSTRFVNGVLDKLRKNVAQQATENDDEK